jgi:hypothetical protein
MIVEIVLILFLIIGIAYLTIYYMNKSPDFQGKAALYELSSPTQVLENDFMSWDSNACSLRFAIFISNSPRTVSKVDCVESTANKSFGPSCSDYTFKICSCTDVSCSNCTLTDGASQGGYLSKLLYMGDVMELWTSGYTSQNDKPYIPAILKLKTAKDASNYFIESISLPAIPLQKWTIISIVKEGRRIDVFYGSTPVASSYCTYVPVPANRSDNLYAGNTKWKGKIGLFSGKTAVQTSDDVMRDVSSIVDSRGSPLYLEKMTFDFDISLPSCILGNCNVLPTVKPRNPFAVYSSSIS